MKRRSCRRFTYISHPILPDNRPENDNQRQQNATINSSYLQKSNKNMFACDVLRCFFARRPLERVPGRDVACDEFYWFVDWNMSIERCAEAEKANSVAPHTQWAQNKFRIHMRRQSWTATEKVVAKERQKIASMEMDKMNEDKRERRKTERGEGRRRANGYITLTASGESKKVSVFGACLSFLTHIFALLSSAHFDCSELRRQLREHIAARRRPTRSATL